VIKNVRKNSGRFYSREVLIILLTLCLALGISLSAVYGMPDDANDGIIPEDPMLTESQTDPNLPGTDPNTPEEKTIDMGNGITMEFVLIRAGEFDMGSLLTERGRKDDEGPVRRVKISRPFYMGKYEVTQEQYYAVAKSKPSRFKEEGHPVENISWDQANRFCKKLSQIKSVVFRLPTEAEWEYACRAGGQDRFYFGDDPNDSQIEQYAWYSKNSDSTTQTVGEKKPNSFGLYDMHGNVWEWCRDYYAADYYKKSITVDPIGSLFGKLRVYRGGGWYRSAKDCRSANRNSLEPYYIRNHIGFRVLLEVE
jgi:formylglycine-generating enzyme required for sulfatase activity